MSTYLAYVTVQLSSKSYANSLPDPIRIEATSPATAANRAIRVASKTDMCKRKHMAFWQVRIVPVK